MYICEIKLIWRKHFHIAEKINKITLGNSRLFLYKHVHFSKIAIKRSHFRYFMHQHRANREFHLFPFPKDPVEHLVFNISIKNLFVLCCVFLFQNYFTYLNYFWLILFSRLQISIWRMKRIVILTRIHQYFFAK